MRYTVHLYCLFSRSERFFIFQIRKLVYETEFYTRVTGDDGTVTYHNCGCEEEKGLRVEERYNRTSAAALL